MKNTNGKPAICLIVLLISYYSQTTLAKTVFGISCGRSGCHTTNRNAMTVVDHDTNTDIGQGSFKTYTASPGDTVSLSVNVTNGQNKYAVALTDMNGSTIPDAFNTLIFTPDPSWTDNTSLTPPYYVSSPSGHSWSGTITKRTFQMTLDPATPSGLVAMQFEIAGKNGGQWSQRETFYLNVLPSTPQPGDGDINKDGIVDMLDYSLLMMQWYSTECGPVNEFCYGADINVDGAVDINDLMVIAMNWLFRKPLAIQVADGNDDAEESVTDAIVSLTSNGLELTTEVSTQLIGLRFNNIDIEPGTNITNAYIQFTADTPTTGPTALLIEGQASGNAPPFSNTPGDISSRPVTASYKHWTPSPWNTPGDNGPDQQTPNLATIIEEIINRPSWQQNNSIVIIISGNGQWGATSYDSSPAAAPTLHIEFQ